MSPDLKELQQPLPYLIRPGEVRRTKRGCEAQAIPFLDRTVLETALDVAVGVDGWQVRFVPFGVDGAVRCSLGILAGGVWRWRDDVGYPEGADNDRPAASAATNAFKRAAGRWGAGRFLRDFPKPYLPCKVRMVKGEGKARTPVFSAWACDPQDEMERRLAASRRGGSDRLYAVIEEYRVSNSHIGQWCLAQGVRNPADLSARQRGELESLIVSGHFAAPEGGTNGAAQG